MSGIDPGRTYRERAARLARPAAAAGATTPVLSFRLGEERYGLDLAHVREVVSPAAWVPVPGARRELAGVMNVRGDILPVWDLKHVLGIEAANGAGSVVLLRRDQRPAGLLVDQVEEIRQVRPEEWAPAARSAPYVKRATADLLLVLDPDELLKEAGS